MATTPTFKTAKEVYDYNIGQGMNDSAANQAAVAFKPAVDPNRQAQLKSTFATEMKNMGITSASDPGWTAASEALTKQANKIGVSNTEYSQAMSDWNDDQLAAAKTQAEKSTQYNGGMALTEAEIAKARSGIKGWTGEEIAAKGREMGLTPDQFASIFGETG